MAVRFPEETNECFTVQEWERFDVIVEEVKRDSSEAIARSH